MKVLAIDPGMRNLAFVFTDGGLVCTARRVDIFEGLPINKDTCFNHINVWCAANANLFHEADVVVIEKQFMDGKVVLSSCLLVVQTVLQMWAGEKCLLVHAMTVKKYYGTNRGSHPLNKRASIEMAKALWPGLCEIKEKVDDIADAFLLAHFAAHNSFSHALGKGCRWTPSQRSKESSTPSTESKEA
jgi:Holliday junction resolvasome RuvABC endonuclease subunit